MTPEQVPAYAMALMEMAQTNVKRHAKDLQLFRQKMSDRQRRALLHEALHDLRRAIELVERYELDVYETPAATPAESPAPMPAEGSATTSADASVET